MRRLAGLLLRLRDDLAVLEDDFHAGAVSEMPILDQAVPDVILEARSAQDGGDLGRIHPGFDPVKNVTRSRFVEEGETQYAEHCDGEQKPDIAAEGRRRLFFHVDGQLRVWLFDYLFPPFGGDAGKPVTQSL